MLNPIIDQHSYRAYRLIEQSAGKIFTNSGTFRRYRRRKATACYWFREILDRENIYAYEDSRVIGLYLFALGKYAKMTKKEKQESKP